jgi:hypothetical protein
MIMLPSGFDLLTTGGCVFRAIVTGDFAKA